MLSAADKQLILEQFQSGDVCPDCKGIHTMACPRIKRKCYHPNGNLTEVEYWPYSEYKDAPIVWLESVFEDDEEEDEHGTAP